MSLELLLVGILPVLVFAIVDSTSTPRRAILAAMLMAVAELVYSLVRYGELDSLTILSFLLVLVLGGLAFLRGGGLLFKFQPAVLGVFLAGACAWFYFVLDRPILLAMGEKYLKPLMIERMVVPALPPSLSPTQREQLLANLLQQPLEDLAALTPDGRFQLSMFRVVSRDLTWFFLLHALFVALAAWKLSTWWWFAVRVPGFYLLFIPFFFLERHLALP